MRKDRYRHTKEENIFIAKKLLAENVYCGIRMEGTRLTFPQTKTILDGINVPNATIDDIQSILNLRDAWKYVLSTVDEPFSLNLICKINGYVARNESLEWGVLRNGDVGISGTDYRPMLPIKSDAERWISSLMERDKSMTEKAIDYFLWGARSQLFWDGNKRTSLIAANKIMIMGGAGILNINEKHMDRFNHLLTEFYETNDSTEIKGFLYEECIKGINRPMEKSMEPEP